MLTFLALTILTAPPPLPVTLRLEPTPGSSTAVVFRLTNEGDGPVRVVDHRSLLALEVHVPGRRAAVRCGAPAGTRPGVVDPERVVELSPGASLAEAIDVRWFCWSPRERKALSTEGATVSARYGFRRAGPRTWVAASPDGATRVGSLEAEPIDLGSGPSAVESAPSEGATLSLRPVPARTESASGRSISLRLQLRNVSPDDVRVFVRPELFGFQVTGPTVSQRCSLPVNARAPLRESFNRLRTSGQTSIALDVSAICPSDTFAAPGVYDVEPVFGATEDGAGVGLRAFTGAVVGVPAVVRVTSGDLATYESVEPAR